MKKAGSTAEETSNVQGLSGSVSSFFMQNFRALTLPDDLTKQAGGTAPSRLMRNASHADQVLAELLAPAP